VLKVIRSLLLKIVDDIDAGNSNISEGEAIKIVDSLKRFTDKEKRLSKYAACEYLNVSRATFDNYIREGKLPRGKHEIGFKELSWSEKELDEFVKKCSKKHSLA
jgi:predicted DNA-binding transcriptional regulator AlpA